MEVYGRFWVKKDGKNFLGLGKVELLRGIRRGGSISSSARVMRMSYKAAWDSVDAMNNLSPKPFSTTSTGGRGGGGAKITKEGELAIEAFEELEKAKAAFCAHFESTANLADLKQRAIEIQQRLRKA